MTFGAPSLSVGTIHVPPIFWAPLTRPASNNCRSRLSEIPRAAAASFVERYRTSAHQTGEVTQQIPHCHCRSQRVACFLFAHPVALRLGHVETLP